MNTTSDMYINSYIRKMPEQDRWCVYTEKGRSMGCYPSRAKAEKRLQQVEMFKHMGVNISIEEIENRVNKLPLYSNRQMRIIARSFTKKSTREVRASFDRLEKNFLRFASEGK